MKKKIIIDQEKIKKSVNNSKEPENDWEMLLKGLIQQVMDDYIRLQHPSKRTFTYLKEAFCAAISCLWDEDYIISWPSTETKENMDISFKEILAQRFGIYNLNEAEINKINMGIIQDECIQEAKNYWINKQLSVVQIPDFFIFDGRAFSIWKTEEESSVDYESMIIYIENLEDEREFNQTFIKLCMEIAAYYRDLKIKPEQIEEFSNAWYEILRMNGCFR